MSYGCKHSVAVHRLDRQCEADFKVPYSSGSKYNRVIIRSQDTWEKKGAFDTTFQSKPAFPRRLPTSLSHGCPNWHVLRGWKARERAHCGNVNMESGRVLRTERKEHFVIWWRNRADKQAFVMLIIWRRVRWQLLAVPVERALQQPMAFVISGWQLDRL